MSVKLCLTLYSVLDLLAVFSELIAKSDFDTVLSEFVVSIICQNNALTSTLD